MKTSQTKPKHDGRGSRFNWRWTALFAVLAALIAGRATAGTLTLTSTPINAVTQYDLSAEGDLDWAKWGSYATADYDHKAGVTPLIGNYAPIGTPNYGNYGGDNARCNWIDGTQDQAQANQGNAIWASGSDTGYQLNIPASTTPVVLHLYLGSWQKNGQLELSLSDSSAAGITNILPLGTEWRHTITFAANSAAQTLQVNWHCEGAGGLSYGNVTLVAATLSSATALPLSVPQPTLSSGSAVRVGSVLYVKASPKGMDATGNTAFAYQWQLDNGGGYVNIAGGTGNPLQATVGAVGTYNYRVVVTNSVLGGVAVTSAPVAVTVTAPTGMLGVSTTVLPTPAYPSTTASNVDLTAEGVTDWAYWGLTGPGVYDTKANIIGDFVQIGTGAEAQLLPGSASSFSWTDATTANTSSGGPTTVTAGMPAANGYLLNIPASTTAKLVNIYVSTGKGLAQVQASMSDGSAPVFVDYPATTSGTIRYTIAFSAASAAQTLQVRVTQASRTASGAVVALQAASLLPVPALSVSLAASPGTAVLVGQPMVIAATALGAPAFVYVWQRDSGTGYTNIPNASAAKLAFNASSTAGYRVIVSGSQGSITSAPVALTVSAATGVLKLIAVENSPASANLTQEGRLDWSHWGNTAASDWDYKATGGNKISNFTMTGPSPTLARFGGAVIYKWTDGTPTAAGTNGGGVYRYPAGSGFQIDVEAATTNRLLNVYFGSYQAPLHVQAYMSDYSAVPVIDETFAYSAGGSAWSKYSFQFASPTPGAKMTFLVWFETGGNVTFSAATLQGMPALTSGTAVISPTNVVAAGSLIALDAVGSTGVPLLKYQWQLDSGSGYANLPGATNAHLATASGSVIGSKSYRVVVTDISGSVTSAPAPLTVRVPTSTLTGSHIATTTANMYFDLTTEGTLDWAKWGTGGTSGYDQKDNLPGLISQYSLVGDPLASIISFGGAFYFSWNNGAPTATATENNQGIYVVGTGNGFEVDAAAASTNRVFNLYFSSYQCLVHVDAQMSDNSAPIFVDESVYNPGGNIAARYSFTYSSPNPAAVLKVRYWDLSGVNCTLWAASLGEPNVLKVKPVGGGQLQVTWPIGQLLEAPTLTGPWTTNSSTSPYTFTPTGAQKFFRAIQ